MYWITLGEGGGRITLPSLVAPAIGHLFLIIEGRVRRVGHFIKKKELANGIITKNNVLAWRYYSYI